MGEVLGLGVTHYPPLSGCDADMANILKGRLQDPDVPAHEKDPANWPAEMRAEWGDDEGLAGAARHRAAMLHGLRKAREALDAFNPDFVIIWGDDQYENFRETIIPPFCVMAYEDMAVRPWGHASESAMFSDKEDEWGGGKPNVWKERKDFEIMVRGHRKAAKHIVESLLERDFDVYYAYKPLHHPSIPHAFLNSILYLDYDRRGFPWPVVPFQINCYGRAVISYRGFISRLADRGRELDPPSPSPRRAFDLGAEVARICAESPWRVALIASSSWSHAFLVDRTYRMQPDVELDRKLYDALVAGNWDVWRNLTLRQIEESGDQELLNWFALAGAMNALGQPCAWSDFVQTYVFNSSKVTAIFPPAGGLKA
ncbi:MAG: extradiol ring-cleavage dioxygenase [Sphingomonadaceae bacterium]|nr:extradiol ring-cleavage dioxygenase [Sphingomonadaceae bacterium]